jgi:O-antigen/teichoic acid export membrane protein
MIFAVLGVNNYGNRSIAAVRDNKSQLSATFCSIYACQFIASALMTILYVVYLALWCRQYQFIAFLQIFYILGNMLDVSWLFYGLEEFKVTVMRNSLVKISGLVAIFVFVKTPDDLWKYTLIVAGSSFLGNALLWPFVRKKIEFQLPKFSDMKRHIKPIFLLFMPVLAISIFANMDKYMIGKMSNVLQSGYYENANKIIEIPKAVITALGTVMLPRTVNLIATGQEEKSKDYIGITMIYTILLGSAFVFGMAAVAEMFSIVFWGEEFLTSGRLIAMMSPAILFSVFGNVIRTQYLIPRAKDREYTVSLIVGAITNLCVNAVLIPRMGAMGATIATVISEFVMTFLQAWYVRGMLDIKKYLSDGMIFIVFGAAMYILLKCLETLLNDSIFSLLALIVTGGVFYLALAGLYLKHSKKECMQQIWNMSVNQVRKRT